ncbi:hypothetical protein [Vibrio alginolyticus]|uniref:hypothetical protein n=1 Tax=Vibrio TaxID=662 RepID=UPI0006CA658A|nr:hypothetical protein [Vibrio alginolyticus]KPM97470.1 hypothetical protein AOG25_13440 [Vibrio alginolyticus]CAH7187157.1 conserved hypothetical protein [Vibrio chagasii]CAH7356033.1 conserved hypothetical protein [Vibrio chagasii]
MTHEENVKLGPFSGSTIIHNRTQVKYSVMGRVLLRGGSSDIPCCLYVSHEDKACYLRRLTDFSGFSMADQGSEAVTANDQSNAKYKNHNGEWVDVIKVSSNTYAIRLEFC